MIGRRLDGWSVGAIIALIAFVGGIVAGWWMRSAIVSPHSFAQAAPATAAAQMTRPRTSPVGTAGTAPSPTATSPAGGADPAVAALATRKLELPIENADVGRMRGSFDEIRGGHRHEAVDILAPRGTPIHAVDDGTVAKLFESKSGGHTLYEFDPGVRYCYYYAHLDRYVEGLHDGETIRRGQVIGYVGTSGDAPPDTPHLHFTIFELTAAKHWWQGRAIDPYLVFSHHS
jgi:peptidoglycan LD-endopeptidase LytH